MLLARVNFVYRFYSKRDGEYALERVDGRWLDGRELRVAQARYSRPVDESRPKRRAR